MYMFILRLFVWYLLVFGLFCFDNMGVGGGECEWFWKGGFKMYF